MLLAHSLKLLGLFVSLSIFASATPIDIDIVSSPAALERRVPQDEKNKCPIPSVWQRRECIPTEGPRAWRDICVYQRTRPFLAPIYTYLRNDCPENHLCLPDYDADGDLTIRCVPQDEDDGRRRKKPKTGGAQYGSTQLVVADSGNKNTQKMFTTTIGWDILKATVSALFISSDASFVVAPNNIIVGKIKSTGTTVCQGDRSNPQRSRECYPTGQYDLKAKEEINYTYGLSNGQSGYLNYAVIPSVHDELR